jgi:hypothetical protein
MTFGFLHVISLDFAGEATQARCGSADGLFEKIFRMNETNAHAGGY